MARIFKNSSNIKYGENNSCIVDEIIKLYNNFGSSKM